MRAERSLRPRQRHRRTAASVAAALVLALGSTVALAGPAAADDAPTWAQVQAAKANAAAAKQELARIAAAVSALQAQQTVAANAELQAAYAATLAADALTAATGRLDALQGELASARRTAAAATARFAATEVQLSRMGGAGDLTARMLIGSGGDLLGELTALDQLTRRSAALETAARQQQNIVTSLQAQAAVAQKERTALKADADQKLQVAQAAQADAQAQLAAGQLRQNDLVAMAQTLGGRAASLQNAYDTAQRAAAASGGSTGTIDTSGVVVDPAAAKAYARSVLGRYGWGDDQYGCLLDLWTMESGWRANAYNPSSGAYGIPQAWPADKMQSAGADWMTNANTQINWGLGYIKAAYGSPCAAWAFEMSHTPHWY